MLWITFYSYSAQLAWQNAQSALSNKFQPCQWRKLYNGDKFVMTSSLRSRQARNVQLYSNLRINTDESKGFSRRLIKTGMELGHMTELEMSIQRGSQDLHCKGLGFANKATKSWVQFVSMVSMAREISLWQGSHWTQCCGNRKSIGGYISLDIIW